MMVKSFNRSWEQIAVLLFGQLGEVVDEGVLLRMDRLRAQSPRDTCLEDEDPDCRQDADCRSDREAVRKGRQEQPRQHQ